VQRFTSCSSWLVLVFLFSFTIGCSPKRAIKMQPNLPPELSNYSKGTVGADLLKGDWLGHYRATLTGVTCSGGQIPSGNPPVCPLGSSIVPGIVCPYGGTPSGDPLLCPSGVSIGDERKQLRNSIIDAIVTKIDIEYYRYSSGLQIGNGYIGLMSDMAVLGLNSAGAVVGEAELKSILAVASAGVVGTTASIDKKLFLDQSRQAVVATMNGSRAISRAYITCQEKNNVAAYTMEAALSDLQNYYASGTITSAFLSIQTQAGIDTKTGQQNMGDSTQAKGASSGSTSDTQDTTAAKTTPAQAAAAKAKTADDTAATATAAAQAAAAKATVAQATAANAPADQAAAAAAAKAVLDAQAAAATATAAQAAAFLAESAAQAAALQAISGTATQSPGVVKVPVGPPPCTSNT
jgi:hypothetical protein